MTKLYKIRQIEWEEEDGENYWDSDIGNFRIVKISKDTYNLLDTDDGFHLINSFYTLQEAEKAAQELIDETALNYLEEVTQ